MKVKGLLTVALFLFTSALSAQTAAIKGRVVDRLNRKPITEAVVRVDGMDLAPVQVTDKGEFIIEGLAPGDYRLTVTAPDFQQTELGVKVAATPDTKDVGMVILAPDVTSAATTTATEAADEYGDFDDETSLSDAQNLPSTLRANQDVFDQAARWNFGTMRFRNRGYDSGTADINLNGIYYNDAMTGYSPYALWGGLNDVTRNSQTSSALGVLDSGLGGINSVTDIDTRPSAIRAGTNVSAMTNSASYALRLMATYSSGFNAKGWAWAVSASTRQGGNNWVKGMYYNAWSYYAGVEKRFGFNNRHDIALMFMGAPTVRGAQMAATQEAYDLLDNNYFNTNCGYQDGKVRNTHLRNYH